MVSATRLGYIVNIHPIYNFTERLQKVLEKFVFMLTPHIAKFILFIII